MRCIYGLKCKPTSIKNPQANAILECVHQTIMGMLRTAEIDMADTVSECDIADFLINVAWAICSTYHMVLKASPGAVIFGRDMLFDIPFIAYWNKIGDSRQCKLIATQDVKTRHVSTGITKLAIKYSCIKVVFSTKQKIRYDSDPWTIMSVNTNGTIRVQCRTNQNMWTLEELHHTLVKYEDILFPLFTNT